jgi:hypothetical protein
MIIILHAMQFQGAHVAISPEHKKSMVLQP